MLVMTESQPTAKDRLDSKRFSEAIRQGSVDAISLHTAAGRTITLRKDGQVVRVPAEELLKEL
jgi:hypothetical protein